MAEKHGSCMTVGLDGLRPFTVEMFATITDSGREFVLAGEKEHRARELKVRLASTFASLGRPLGSLEGVVVATSASAGSRGFPVPYDTAFDLAAAFAIKAALDDEQPTRHYIGELGLTGDVKAVCGVLPRCSGAMREVVVPEACSGLAELSRFAEVFAIDSFAKVLKGQALKHLGRRQPEQRPAAPAPALSPETEAQLDELHAGHKNPLFVGGWYAHPLLSTCRRFAERSLNLPATEAELRTMISIYDVAGLQPTAPFARPLRMPHHSVSTLGMIGSTTRPGEVSLAHGGVLVLDEVVEFRAETLSAISQALVGGRKFPSTPLALAATGVICCGRRWCNCSDARKAAGRKRLDDAARLLDMEVVLLEE